MANEINRIPSVLIDYAVYLENSRLIGTGEITLPTLTAQTSEVSGAGIGGTLEIPVLAHFDSMTLGINFRTVEMDAALLMQPIAHKLLFRAAQQAFDGAGGQLFSESVLVYVTGVTKSHELGTLKVGEPVDAKVELEVTRIRIVKEGNELLEVDKLNGIYRVLGVDFGYEVRAELGIT